MRRLIALASLLVLQCAFLVALPTLTSATATPRPVTAALQQLPLTTFDTSMTLRSQGSRATCRRSRLVLTFVWTIGLRDFEEEEWRE